jgi:hypothetical protein
MAAFVGKSCVQYDARFGVNTGLWKWALKYCPKQILALRMSDCTSCFTLLTTDTALRVNENSLHVTSPLSGQHPWRDLALDRI